MDSDEQSIVDVLSLTETALITFIFSATTATVLYRVRGRLEINAYITIATFLLCEILNLIVFMLKVVRPGMFEDAKSANIFSQYGLYAVLFYYTYQMKLVILKMTSDTRE